MAAKILRIISASRFPYENDQDHLEFSVGVNLIVGELNVGKTKWLDMIDFALGDRGTPEKAFNQELADKYDSIQLKVLVGDLEHTIERRWKEKNAKSKIFLDGNAITAVEFSTFMLDGLGIPRIELPSGNPFDREWVELSWRELFRHMYKWEKPWSGFVEMQPPVTRSACILHFLQSSQQQFLESFGLLVRKRKELLRMKAQQDLFSDVLQDLAVDLSRQKEMTVAVTPESIQLVRHRLNSQLSEQEGKRAQLLLRHAQQLQKVTPEFAQFKERLEQIHKVLKELFAEKAEGQRRLDELQPYLGTLKTELAKLERLKVAGLQFADLKVTHCPSCDQTIPPPRFDAEHCQVCGQFHRPILGNVQSTAGRRIEFEEQQIREEVEELESLIKKSLISLKETNDRIQEAEKAVAENISAINRSKASSEVAIPPEISVLDESRGKIQSELSQLDRIGQALTRRAEMNLQISNLEEEISTLDSEAKEIRGNVNYGDLSVILSDRMNDYLNALNVNNLALWKTDRIKVKLDDRDMTVNLGNEEWTRKAGGSVQYIVQLAYHYALLSLTKDPSFKYPGFLIVDFPPQLASAEDLADSENYLLEPFVSLCAEPTMHGSQVIIAGRAFQDLPNANVIRLGNPLAQKDEFSEGSQDDPETGSW